MAKKRYKVKIKSVLLLLSLVVAVPILLLINSSNLKRAGNFNDNEPRDIVTALTTTTTEPPKTTTTYPIPYIQSPVCKTSALYCVDDDEILYGFNIYGRVAPASLTKIMTAATALRYMDIDEEITAGTELELVQPGSSLCFIQQGGTSSLYDFLYGLFLPSGNDAAYTIAASVARKCAPELGSDKEAVKYFCELMNDLAAEIGMDKSHFSNPDGWDGISHYTTAYDLIKLTKYAITDPVINEIAGTFNATVEFGSGEIYEWQNSNRLLDPNSDFYCEDVYGMKTGTTERAGKCVIAVFDCKGKTYISVVVGCSTDEARYELTMKMKDAIK